MNDEQRLDVGGVGVGADGVEVALDELAIPTALGVLTAPDGSDVITLERRSNLSQVLRCKACERHGQVEPHRHVAVAAVLELEELLVGFLAPFAGQNLGILQGGSVDRAEAIAAEDAPRGLHQPLAHEHGFGQVIAEAFERARSDKW